MLNCRRVVHLVSQAMDTPLPWPQRLAVRLHLLYCVWCRRYAAHLRLLRRAARQYAHQLDTASQARLSPEAKARILRRLREPGDTLGSDAGR